MHVNILHSILNNRYSFEKVLLGIYIAKKKIKFEMAPTPPPPAPQSNTIICIYRNLLTTIFPHAVRLISC